MKRTLFSAEHEAFRDLVRSFIAREVVPVYPEWEAAGCPPRDVFRRLGEIGVMGMNMDEKWGGAGQQDYVYNVVLQEETARAGVTIGPLRTHLDVVLPYFRRYADDSQQLRWFPGICTGDLMTAIALTEPDTGSDLAAVRTTAVRDGDHYVLNGAKTYITGGSLAELFIVLCRTSTDQANRRHGLSSTSRNGTSSVRRSAASRTPNSSSRRWRPRSRPARRCLIRASPIWWPASSARPTRPW